LFKFIGFILGFYVSGFWLAILGLFIGSSIDRARAYGTGGMNPLQNAMRQTVFLETAFILMGKMAKADGRVSEAEVAHVEQFMHKLGMTAEHSQQGIALFKKGADADFDIEPTFQRFMSVCGNTKNLKDVLLSYLIVMAMADGEFHSSEEALLADIASRLGYSDAAFRQMLDMIQNQAHFSGGQVNTAEALEGAHKALGVTENASADEIKRAYRKLMSQYHPDKLMGQGLPEDMIAQATEQAKEIQLAYDLIKKDRGM